MQALAADACEMPRDNNGKANDGAPPRIYRDWALVAWADLLAATPDEPEAPEVDTSAEQDFRRRLAGALTRIVSLSCATPATRAGEGRQDDDRREARSILHWCLRFARPGPWASVRSYYVWSRLEGDTPDPYVALRVAIRPELLGQLGLRDLEDLGQERLADLCERYAVGTRCRAGKGGQRAIALDPEWWSTGLQIHCRTPPAAAKRPKSRLGCPAAAAL
jgi:hypothetical protein